MSKRRYNEQQIGAILQRSGEIQAGISPEGDSHGLTLEELQKVAQEVGIEPHVVEQAALEVDNGALGGKKGESASRVLDHTVDGIITEEQWEDIVIRLRQYAGKAGTSTLQGTTREWTGDWDMGSMTLTASTRNNQTRFRLLADASGAGALPYIFGPMLGLFVAVGLCGWVGKSGFGALAVIGTLLFVSTLCLFLTRTWAQKWQKKSQRDTAQLFTDIIAKASSGAALPAAAPAVAVEDEVVQRLSS